MNPSESNEVRTCAGCGEPIQPSGPNDHRRKWCSGRCRKASYGDPCVDCGARTSYGAEKARIAEPRCSPCARAHYVHWTPERIIDRIQEWASIHGDPPAAPDWCTSRAELMNDPARAQRFRDAKGHWPAHTTVFEVFPSWNAAMEAAGFAGRAAHGGGGNERRRRSIRERQAA